MEKFIERLFEEDIKFEKDVNNGLSDINIFEALDVEIKVTIVALIYKSCKLYFL